MCDKCISFILEFYFDNDYPPIHKDKLSESIRIYKKLNRKIYSTLQYKFQYRVYLCCKNVGLKGIDSPHAFNLYVINREKGGLRFRSSEIISFVCLSVRPCHDYGQ